MTSKGQSGIEYIVVTGFALLALTPVLYLLFTSVQSYQTETASAQMSAVGRELIATAERVYHSGPPSKLTVEVRIPDGVQAMIIRRNNPDTTTCTKCTELLYVLNSGGQVVSSTQVDVHGVEPWEDDGGVSTYPFNQSMVSAGTRRFTLEAVQNYVILRQA